MIQKIASGVMIATGVAVASEPQLDSAWSLVGVIASIIGGIWLTTRTIIAGQSARIAKLEADNAELARRLELLTKGDMPKLKSPPTTTWTD